MIPGSLFEEIDMRVPEQFVAVTRVASGSVSTEPAVVPAAKIVVEPGEGGVFCGVCPGRCCMESYPCFFGLLTCWRYTCC